MSDLREELHEIVRHRLGDSGSKRKIHRVVGNRCEKLVRVTSPEEVTSIDPADGTKYLIAILIQTVAYDRRDWVFF